MLTEVRGKGLKQAKRISCLKILLSCLRNNFISYPCVGFLVWTKFSSPLVKYQRAQRLDYAARICLVLKKTAILQWVCTISHSHQQWTRVPISLHSHQHLMVSVFWTLALLIGVQQYLIVVLICIALMTYGGHRFIYFWPSIYLLVRCLFRYSYFLIEWVGCFLLLSLSILCTPGTTIISNYTSIYF